VADRLLLISGEGAGVDDAGLARRCGEWARELGIEVELRWADPPAHPVDALTGRDPGVRGAVLDRCAAAESPALHDVLRRAGVPVVWADLRAPERAHDRPPPDVLGAVRGRGIAT
jgi:hypothetical protein